MVAGLAGMTFANAQPSLLGLVMRPLSMAFGWSRAEISASALITSLSVLVFAPLAGRLADRFSPRRVAMAGVLLFSAAQACVGLSGPGLASWYVSWVFAGVSYAAVSPVIWSYGVNRWFDRGRGLALAVALSGTGLASSLTPVLAARGLAAVGWRGMYFGVGALGLMVVLPVVWLFFRTPEEGTVGAGGREVEGMTAREIISSRAFWALACAIFLLGAGMGTLSLHLQPMMRDAGLSAIRAANYASLMGFGQIVGRLLVGQLLDRLPTRLVVAVCFVLPVVAAALLIGYKGGSVESLLIAITIGLSLGAEVDVMAYLTSRYFGLKSFGLCYAILFGAWGVSFGLSSVAAGAVFDLTGSYAALLGYLIGGLVLSSSIVALTRAPKRIGAVSLG